uniref:Uncharacterized protein n=1 Tax=Setaria viridis TaxID=4556 RepID=A0A4U6TMP3_SETVI|nr:hypothetical protein SEVIR_8G203900v2 [Setaria viridis]
MSARASLAERAVTTGMTLSLTNQPLQCICTRTLHAGARSGCSITTASRKCKPPWWKGLFGAAPTDYEERERCLLFAKGKCIAPIQDARIASNGLLENTDFDVWRAGSGKASSTLLAVPNNQHLFSSGPGVTSYKGSDLLYSLSSEERENSR